MSDQPGTLGSDPGLSARPVRYRMAIPLRAVALTEDTDLREMLSRPTTIEIPKEAYDELARLNQELRLYRAACERWRDDAIRQKTKATKLRAKLRALRKAGA